MITTRRFDWLVTAIIGIGSHAFLDSTSRANSSAICIEKHDKFVFWEQVVSHCGVIPRRSSGTLVCSLAGFSLRCFFFRSVLVGCGSCLFLPVLLNRKLHFFFFSRSVSSFFGPLVSRP